MRVSRESVPLVFAVMTVAALVVAVVAALRYVDPNAWRWTLLWIVLPCALVIVVGLDFSARSAEFIQLIDPARGGLALAAKRARVVQVLGFGLMLVSAIVEWNANRSLYASLTTATIIGFYVASLGHLALVRRFG